MSKVESKGARRTRGGREEGARRARRAQRAQRARSNCFSSLPFILLTNNAKNCALFSTSHDTIFKFNRGGMKEGGREGRK